MKLQNSLDHRPGTRSAIFRKYFFPVSLIMLCAFSLLAGCQLQNILTPEDQPTLESTATSSPIGTLTPGATPTAETAAPTITLVIWLPPHLDPENGTPAGEILKERLVSFQLDHPQYTVVVRIKALEGESGINGALESASTIAPASLPSIVALPYSIMESAAVDGLLAPISSDTLIINDPDWLPYAREVARVNDTAYGTPFGGDALVLAYRPLVVPDPPKTWQGVINQEQFVSFPADESSAAVVTQMYLSAGGSLQNSDGSPVLEYDPLEINEVVAPILEGKADVVLGSRFLVRRASRSLYFRHFMANKFITFLSNLFTDLNLTDVETCYKAFRGEIIRNMIITSRRFGFEVEVVAKVAKLKCRVFEVPISYYGRSYEEGKKIGFKDGWMALFYILKYNLFTSKKASFKKL